VNLARLGKARQGKVSRGKARPVMVVHGMARPGAAGLGRAGTGGGWLGQAWLCGVRRGQAWQGSGFFNKGDSVKTVKVEIRGITPLLIHRFNEEAEQGKKTRRVEVKQRDPREEATKNAYIAKDGTFYFSAFSIPNAMGAAGSNHKATGTRKTLRYVVPSAVRMLSDVITILNGSGPAKDFEVDSRPVTIPATKGRIMRHRPRFNQWGAEFELLINDDLLSPEMAHQLLSEAGQGIGIGDFRPEKRGPFGTFRVVKFEE